MVAGFIGALLGLGGGIVIVPALTILFGYDIKVAAAASLVSVIATSTAAATVYVAERLTNIRLGMVLETSTTIGAFLGGWLAVYISGRYLYMLFAAVLLYAAYNMLRGRGNQPERCEQEHAHKGIPGSFTDPSTGKTVTYTAERIPLGLVGSAGAGIISGLLGVGGGIIKVPLMHRAMRIPIKAAIATSNFMIGVTAAAGAFVYWSAGYVNAAVTAPTAIGVLLGARIGTRVAGKARAKALTVAFVILLVITAVQMVLKGIGGR